MSDTPDISVVMSVYNGAPNLRETIDSVLTQEGVSLEFIIVNDGSTDDSPTILEEYAGRDSRVKIIHQENQGLTKALIKGCAEAKGIYIARQDVGDISLPGRLVKQLVCIEQNPVGGLVSCGTRFVGPEHEYLYEISPNPNDATARLLTLDLKQIKGPSIHGCTMFPRRVYDQVGGYRAEFYFAQDLDLWIRMAERVEHVVLAETLYEASVSLGSISGLYRHEQIDIARFILKSAELRRSGQDDREVLDRAKRIKPTAKRARSRSARARWLYFIGMCLKRNRSPHAARYFRKALGVYPLHVRSAVRLLLR